MGTIVAFRAERGRNNQGRPPADATGRRGEIVLLPCIRRERLASATDGLDPRGEAGRPVGERGGSAAAAIRLG